MNYFWFYMTPAPNYTSVEPLWVRESIWFCMKQLGFYIEPAVTLLSYTV